MAEEVTQIPATIHFPSGRRRAVFLKLTAILAFLLGGKVVRHD